MARLTQEYAESIVNSRIDATKIHVDPFIYIGTEATKLKCVCKVCGHTWNPNYHNFTTGRVQACKECHNTNMASRYRLNINELNGRILEMSERLWVHPFVYTNQRTAITYTCKTCNYSSATPLRKSGLFCKRCGYSKSDISKRMSSGRPTLLYYVYFPKYHLWKIGCTEKSIAQRFQSAMSDITVIYSKLYAIGSDAYSIERKALRATKLHSVNELPEDLLRVHGVTEFRTKPIPLSLLN
jgi:hypothetical protein